MFVIIIVSILIGLIFSPLGCFVLWKRYVYFADGLAHASMLAGIIGVIAGIPIFYAGLINTIIFAFIIFKLRNNSGNNAAIGLTSSIMIATSLILSHWHAGTINISNYLVGDIVSATKQDIIILISILMTVIIFLIFSYKDLILIILSRDVAASRGIKVQILELIFLTILSFSVLFTIKIVGALLVTSIILIPAMTARIIANSPQKMIALAALFSILMNSCGIVLSLYADIPFAPIIILCGGVIYLLTSYIKYCSDRFS